VFLLSISSAQTQQNANEGKKFLVTFPQNTVRNMDNTKLNIYIMSTTGANVHISYKHTQREMDITVPPNGMITLPYTYFGNAADIEDMSSGQISDKVFEINSDNYISVYVVNSKEFTSDGYLAYPVSEWDNNYIHNSFYHFVRGSFSTYKNRASGCSIISQADGTQVQIILKGRGQEYGSTQGGTYRIGDTIRVTLNENESYTFKTFSTYNNTFDLSGSLISSNKPIGVISFHERTLIPQESPDDGMDYLVEMMQPLSNWKNKYISVDFGRGYGDFFRVLPLKDNTQLTIKNYNEDGKLVSTENKIIRTGGNFYEYNNAVIGSYNYRKERGIMGVTIWEADAPILVTQYSYSQDWDKTTSRDTNGQYDPFMLNLINEEQFTTSVNFLAPPYSNFSSHNINLIIKVDTLSNIANQLRSVELDGSPLYLSHSKLLDNRIGNTDYYWLRFQVSPGRHSLKANARFAAFAYGFGQTDSYGLQTALGDIPVEDTLIVVKNNYDCETMNLTYHLESKFGFDSNDGLEPLRHKIVNVKIDFIKNIDLDYYLSYDSLELNLSGTFEDYYQPAIIYLSVTSETGEIFHDSLSFQMKNNIAINRAKTYSSTPGDITEFDIYLDESNDSLMFLTDYNLVIKYKWDWFHLEDIIIDGISYLNQISSELISDTNYLLLNVNIKRENLIGGNKVKILLRNLLNRDTIYTPEFALYSKYGDNCYRGSVIDTLHTAVCFQNLRLVLYDVSSPVSLNSNTILANDEATISLIDYSGRYIINRLRVTKGESVNLLNYNLPKGMYFIIVNNSSYLPPLKYFHF
jgi:hypothetical protein